ncbi:MAG: NADH-quinone oxidoreductase subunit L [Candidatus Zipacnadales bacterium]
MIPLLPLVACGILLGWGVRLHRTIGDRVALIAVVGIAIPCVIAWGILSSRVNQTFRSTPEEGLVAETGGEEVGEELAHGPDPYEMSIEWAVLGRIGQRLPTAKGTFDGKLRVGFYIDNLAAAMLAMVTLISTLIMIYSIGYMHGDERFPRFFAYMSLFCFAMLLLVLANSFVVLFAGWELVGLCSYLLIGFWYERRSAANAAKKAFIVNRVGDFGFLIGIMIVFFHVPSLNIRETLASVATPAFPLGWAAVAGMCLFAGAIGKSAQFPLHVWLPDAMEGPTPVSALIHAATMVAAGVYMVARIAGFYTAVHAFPGPPTFMGLTSLEIVRYIGIITALLAATIGVAQNDIKRVLAYSTVSQLGFMMFGLGMGVFGFVAGIFHLLTHAFFKALLFLGSGSVIHGCGGEQDMRRMGGLRSSMPVTFWTFLMGTLALTGVPFFFSGFWSKDEIMAAAWTEDKLVFWLGEMAAFFTALYMGRLVFLTFGGDHPRDESIHPHESPQVMTIPLIILAVFAVGLGWLGIPGDYNVMEKFLHSSGPAGLAHPSSDFVIAGIHFAMVPLVVSIMAAGLGWLLAAVIWGWKLVDVPALKRIFPPLAWAHTVLKNKYYFDEIYQATFVRGTVALAYAVGTFDRYFIDGIVNAVGWVWGFALTWITRLIDTYVVDGVVNLIGETQKWAGRVVTILQTGRVQQYIAMSALAAALIVAVIYLLGVYSVS